MKRFALLLIGFYQKFISPAAKPFWPGGACRFTPTCSEYMRQAINKYGSLLGGLLGFRRITRCRPFSRGGYDPIP